MQTELALNCKAQNSLFTLWIWFLKFNNISLFFFVWMKAREFTGLKIQHYLPRQALSSLNCVGRVKGTVPARILSHLLFPSGRVFLPDANLFFASPLPLRLFNSLRCHHLNWESLVISKSASLILILDIPGNSASCFSANYPQTCFHHVRPQPRNIL